MKQEHANCKYAVTNRRNGKPDCRACTEAFCMRPTSETKKCSFFKVKVEVKSNGRI